MGAASQGAHARVAQVTTSDRGDRPPIPRQRSRPGADAAPALADGADLHADQLARRLAAVQRRIGALRADAQARSALQARLLSVCDALKARRVSIASCDRRLSRLVADLERIESV